MSGGDILFLGIGGVALIIYLFAILKISKGNSNGEPKTITCFGCGNKLGVISRKPLTLGCINPNCKLSTKTKKEPKKNQRKPTVTNNIDSMTKLKDVGVIGLFATAILSVIMNLYHDGYSDMHSEVQYLLLMMFVVSLVTYLIGAKWRDNQK